MKTKDSVQIFKGIFVHSLSAKEWEILETGFLVTDSNGIILEFSDNLNYDDYPNAIIHDFKEQIICPGFIDLHLHLPQYELVGLGADELLEWLKSYTFPAEERFASEAFARSAIAIFFNELIAYGTTTAAIYPSIHKRATDIAFGYGAYMGIRLIMGKVLMDQNSPDFLIEDTQKGIDDSVELIEKWHGFDDGRIQYAVTPRFAVSCSTELMKKAGEVAEKYDTYIQSHLAENRSELAFIKELFPKQKSYTDVYYEANLLGSKSLMAHCIYLSDDEIALLEKSNSIPVHCPTSNRFLQSGVFPFRKMEQHRLNIALGSDVAGGYELSLLHEMREAIEMSKIHNIVNPEEKAPALHLEEAFYYGTLAAAKALGMEDKIGNFKAGKIADFVVLDDRSVNPYVEINNHYQSVEERMSRLIYRSSKECVKAVYVKAKRIK